MKKLLYYYHEARKKPLSIVCKAVRKIAITIVVQVKALRATLFFTYVSDNQFLRALDNRFKTIDAFLSHIAKRKQPIFFIDSLEKEKVIEIVSRQFPKSIQQTIADADKICEHIFNLLGSGDVYLGQKIDWHIDFKTGWRWKLKYYKKVDYGDLSNPYDVKVPWELSRCQHFVTLGKAYWFVKEHEVQGAKCEVKEPEKYAREFVNQVSDWIDSNPPKLGVNWVCAMDVAIRAVNWIWGYYFFKDSPCLTDEFLLKFLENILAHGRHIMNNLENKGTVTSNHYLSDIAGLVYLGVMFPEFKEARKWREFGIQELINEMEKQVYPDGTDYEASISYHRLVTELFLSATILCLKNSNSMSAIQSLKFGNDLEHRTLSAEQSIFPDWYMERLEKMIEFVMYYTKPDGTAPQIGDNDDGRLHILSNYSNWNRLDHRYLLSISAVLFNRREFKEAAGRFYEEAFWLLGEEGLEAYKQIKSFCPREASS